MIVYVLVMNSKRCFSLLLTPDNFTRQGDIVAGKGYKRSYIIRGSGFVLERFITNL